MAGNTVTLTGVGAVTIRASQPGNLDFNAAPGVSQSFTVTPGGQSIAFTPLKALYSIRTPPFALSATATSGLPVAFSIVTGSATVSGSAITITGPGTITVRASQAGNTLYNPAPNADQTFHAVDNDPPEFSSPPQASASSAGAGQAVTFTAAASDPNNDPLIYSWAFDDGFIGGGAAVTHAFATAGTHSATLTVTDSAGFVIMSSVTLETLPPLYLTGNADDTGIDSDGDRFSDAFEAAAGSDPADGAQTPFDNHGPGTPPRPLPAGSALSIKLNFIKQFSDSLQLKGTLPLSSAGLPLTGHKVVVDIDGVLSAFTLDIKGKSAKSATAGFVISAKPGNGFSKFTLKISKSSLAAIYAKDGLTKTASPDTAAHMLVTILFNNGGYQGTENLLFTQTKGASGKTKQLQ